MPLPHRRVAGQVACFGTFLLVSVEASAAVMSFLEKRAAEALPQIPDVAFADVNGDGVPDLLALNSNGPFIFECTLPPPAPVDCGDQMRLAVSYGQGNGQFVPTATFRTGCYPVAMAVGDFDGDGLPDVVTANQGARDAFGICFGPSLTLLTGTGDQAVFQFRQTLALGDVPSDIVAGDFDEDGLADLLVAFQGQGQPGTLGLFHVDATHRLVAFGSVYLGTQGNRLALGDLDRDGHLDAVVSLPSANSITLLRGDGHGGLVPVESCPGVATSNNPQGVAITDLDGDRVPEIVVGEAPAFSNQGALLRYRRGPGGLYCPSGTSPFVYGTDSVISVGVADFDGDWRQDLVTTNGRGRIHVYRNDTNGWIQPSLDLTAAASAERVTLGEVSGDWRIDIVAGGVSAFSSPFAVSVFLNTTPWGPPVDLHVDGDQVTWDDIGALSYDVVRCDLGVLRQTGDFAQATHDCLANDVTVQPVAIPGSPGLDDGWMVILRARTIQGVGSYDEPGPGQSGLRDPGIAASPLACP